MPIEYPATVCPSRPKQKPVNNLARHLLQKLSIEGLLALNSTQKSIGNEYARLNENAISTIGTKSPDAKKQKAHLITNLNSLSKDGAKVNAKCLQLESEFQ